jgi:hypothetical protein
MKKLFFRIFVYGQGMTMDPYLKGRLHNSHLAWRLEKKDHDSLGSLCYEMKGCTI